MAERSKSNNNKKSPAKAKAPAKTNRATPAKVAAPPQKPSATVTNSNFYVVEESPGVRIITQKPADNRWLAECASFAEAKQTAIDRLIAAVEMAERRLWELKQATAFEDYEQRRRGS